ncbi:histidine phosphatase superfamily [Bombardia bombarda]|uniref:Histidine phosphatase superfamily n=1 Tax=Bombardia bombarda TaxID=252184 RepID=A0AA39XIV9_9PEZI|nr:histidine phosphatase superfamily [Bombardia bombarda]
MGKPRLIILIRHAQSEGNKNRDIHQTIPDHRVKLTQDGWQQAYEAGRQLRKMLRADDTLHFFTSPYRRTRETTEGILATLTSDEPEPSPFKRNNIKVYEEPRLREQDFGNFQPCSAEMERMWQERADYGHFFYRIPNGESAADAYDRISGFNESLWRQFGEDDFASVCVLVTHGLMSRVFLMKWYHFSVEYFEDLRNVNHCEFLIMRKEESGKYLLENNLRTWSELRRERERAKNGEARDVKDGTSTAIRRRWGGCPNGCDHDKNFKIRQTLADLVKSDSIISSHSASDSEDATDAIPTTATTTTSSSSSKKPTASLPKATADNKNNNTPSEDSTSSDPTTASTPSTTSTHGIANPSFNGTANSHTIISRRPAAKRFQSPPTNNGDQQNQQQPHALALKSSAAATTTEGHPVIDVTKAREELVSSPDGTPSFISVEDRLRNHLKSPNTQPPRPLPLPLERIQLHVGRDFGGTYSGHSSAVASDADSSSDNDEQRKRNGSNMPRLKEQNGVGLAVPGYLQQQQDGKQQRENSRMGRGTARANRLGDHPHSSDGEHEADGEHDDDDDDDDEGEEEEESGESGEELTRTLTDEADDVLLERAERDDKSIMGSVY